MTLVSGHLVGREDELQGLVDILEAPNSLPQAAVLFGDPGIGKTTLWLAAADAAKTRGFRVLSARPSDTETGYSFAGLGGLLGGSMAEFSAELPAPQRRALEAALALSDADGTPADEHVIAFGFLGALRLLAAAQPLVVAVDDAQWLDAPSLALLRFALPRLDIEPVAAVFTVRGDAPLWIRRAVPEDRLLEVEVGPLSMGALHELLKDRLGEAVPRPTLRRIWETSGGNPFFALELARAIQRRGGPPGPGEELVLPADLDELVRERLDRLSPPALEVARLVAALAEPTVQLVERAAGRHADAGLGDALEARILELEGQRLRFTHPLLASAIASRLTPAERRALHARLAALVPDVEERSRHLALAASEPDAAVAAALEEAANLARARGAPSVAAELGEHALRLTPPGSKAEADRRAIAAARAHLAAGEVEQGRVLASELVARAPAGAGRAEALALLADVEMEEPRRAIPLMNDALREPGAPVALQASIHQTLSLIVRFTEGLGSAERHARASVELAEQLGDDALRAAALAGLALIRFNAGEPDALRLAEEAYELVSDDPASEPAAEAGFALGHALVWSVLLDRARTHLENLYRDWSERDERIAAYALWYLAIVELRSGRLSLAGEYAERSRELSAQYSGEEKESPQTLYPSALVAAHRGDLERARDLAEQMNRLAEVHATRLVGPAATLAVVELWSGASEAAVARFEAAEQTTDAADGVEPSMCWWRAEQVEALLEVGRVDDAVDRLDGWEADARRLGRVWVLAHATRCRGLVAASRGDVEQAVSLLGEAVPRHEAVGDPFGRARALLALGVARRRLRQKRAAREALEAARAGFDELGARRWAERADAELGRIGGRKRSDGLTPAERRVADLVAKGRTNAEVAAALFLSERTVASHLTHVYAKLGMRSRTELATKLR